MLLPLLCAIVFTALSSSASAQWSIIPPVGLQSPLEVHFIDRENGFALGSSSSGSWTLRTTDGGRKWNSQFWGGWLLFGLSHSDDNTIYASGRSALCGCAVIMRSTDKGKNWEWDTANSSYGFYDVVFPTPEIGYTAGYNGAMFKTTDNGASWEYLTIGEPGDVFTKTFFFDADNGVVLAGSNGEFYNANKIYRTTDGGASWLLVSDFGDAAYFNDISFISPKTGVLLGSIDSKQSILRTEDGGEHWTEIYTNPENRAVFAVDFVDQQIGYAVGSMGLILRTTDGGKTWSPELSPTTESLSDVYVLKDRVYAVGMNNILVERTEISGVWERNNDSEAEKPTLTLSPIPLVGESTLMLHNLPTEGKYTFVLYDRLGREVRRVENISPGTPTRIERNTLGAGLYLYQIIGGGEVVARGRLPVE